MWWDFFKILILPFIIMGAILIPMAYTAGKWKEKHPTYYYLVYKLFESIPKLLLAILAIYAIIYIFS